MLEFADGLQATRKTLFVEVILPLAISRNYTYRVPFDLNDTIAIGKRVVVQFGKSKLYTAVVADITEHAPEKYEAKYLIDILDDRPVVTPRQLQFWHWLAEYYMCNEGEVMNAALPSALKLASETKVMLNKDVAYDKASLNDKEYLITEALDIQPELTISDIAKLLGQKTVMPILKALFEKNIVTISEEVSERYKPRKRTYLTLNPAYHNQDNLRELFTILEKRAPKQADAVLAFIKLSRQQKAIAKNELIEESGSGESSIKSLIEKEVFIAEDKTVSRLGYTEEEDQLSNFILSPAQADALAQAQAQFLDKDVVLLHGVTSSGKTQIYIKLIEEMMATGRQVLYLLPEIALTTHIIERLRVYFGGSIGVYHSRFNDNERVEVWQKVLNNEYKVVLGARSSVFLPFSDLGLIIVDEEHETSYKQYDPAPRYNARDAAIYLANMYKGKVLLGSATPSFETYYNARVKKYGFVELMERYGGVQLPLIEVVSITEETKRKTMQSHFSSVLMQDIQLALDNKEQVILFQNRRGYAPVLMCRVCAYTPKCINCDVSLTYHKHTHKLHCHYCGYKEDTPSICPACGSTHLEYKGFGTEKVEDELSVLMPNVRLARMDLDTTRSRNSLQTILNNLEEKKIDVLVGTQMVAKGLDFADVTVIGIINADSLLKYPDYRANERSYQMLAQVSGRAGRRDKQGKVVIQTYDPNHRVIKQVIENDYTDLYFTEMEERKSFKYPPFYRIISLDIKHKTPEILYNQAEYLANELRKHFGDRVIGPEAPLINRIRNYYIKSIMLKFERDTISIVKAKAIIREVITQFQTTKLSKGSIVQPDVDPY
ncbi:replication restart helicase PriA [Mucilaginibacter phyllosphaerae]|uniref:Replication restart protein PriA n=1 Tax=Mucilaginibacter phyllosphaerae TaxID=1812349 RepID=A0A4Y8A870_9SPHI|nr:primosomal protein N' [Mucilaginibacter phyllosphaerae]MBB3970991.1 primosomal protein N' (replication factor Y) [Mucilaginibacter phyllosphaerae]TEW64077.1 primosomal protein N' [Mucilaginibacter phyllosphaerae]GGH05916.1 primosomal protein N' [Mucilaginibacter phyllosphaerae]